MRVCVCETERADGEWVGGLEELSHNGVGILSVSASECGVKDHTALIGILATWL